MPGVGLSVRIVFFFFFFFFVRMLYEPFPQLIRSIRNGFIAQIHVRFAAVPRLSRAVSRCLALSRA
eukprot:4170634-Prymnesium_polylepis.1